MKIEMNELDKMFIRGTIYGFVVVGGLYLLGLLIPVIVITSENLYQKFSPYAKDQKTLYEQRAKEGKHLSGYNQ